jgi:enoyl-CoA hydratase
VIHVERRNGVAVVAMRAGKANAMNEPLLRAIAEALDEIDGPAVITGDGGVLSAGLALPELIDFDRTRMTELMDTFEATMLRVLTHRYATVAAINGHAFAGGCVLALMCDARVMAAGGAQIGLNEIQLGIGLPTIVVETLRLRLAPAAFGPIAFEGRLLGPDAAALIGLVDEVVDPSALVARAIEIAAVRHTAPLAYQQIKRAQLAPVLDAMFSRSRVVARDALLDTWFGEDAQRKLRATVDRLRKR